MSEECRNDCVGPEPFPKELKNRPGLSRIDYRIGRYSDIREVLLRRLDRDPVLARWTHREADDPGIALLEGAAILGDILTFYQDLYANEAYLRTARWRESLGDLVRLLGYRLTPGLGGRATFAFEIKGDKPVVIPPRFPVRAPLEALDKPAEFQTIDEITACPHLSRFHLYRPRRSAQSIGEGCKYLELESVFMDGAEDEEAHDVGSIQSVDFQAGDRLILVPEGETLVPWSGEILIVAGVEQVLDRTIIELEGSLSADLETSVTAYRIGRSFRHFGHNAPATYTRLDDSDPTVLMTDPTNFFRRIDITHDQYCKISDTEMPLDAASMIWPSGTR